MTPASSGVDSGREENDDEFLHTIRVAMLFVLQAASTVSSDVRLLQHHVEKSDWFIKL